MVKKNDFEIVLFFAVGRIMRILPRRQTDIKLEVDHVTNEPFGYNHLIASFCGSDRVQVLTRLER